MEVDVRELGLQALLHVSAYGNVVDGLIVSRGGTEADPVAMTPAELLFYANSTAPIVTFGGEVELRRDWRQGWMLSAFGWTYCLLQIPGGWLVDRIRPRLFYALICGLWSLATVLQGFAGTFVFRLGRYRDRRAFPIPDYGDLVKFSERKPAFDQQDAVMRELEAKIAGEKMMSATIMIARVMRSSLHIANAPFSTLRLAPPATSAS